MKFSLLITVFVAAFFLQDAAAKVLFNTHRPPPIPTPNPRARAPTLFTTKMKVDNFNSADTRTYDMRYYANPQHFVDGGPIFIYLGGEWEIDGGSLMGGQIYDMAEEHNGYMFYTEHRYYGQSWPTSDFSTANLKYLSVDQALADVAEFVTRMKTTHAMFANSKVVVIGGSYSATMATWMRVSYPDIVDAAYASSAPLLAVDDFYRYFEVVGTEIDRESPSCYTTIQEGTDQMAEMFETAEGLTYLSSLINTCIPLRNEFPHRDNFFNSIGNMFAGTVQYAYPGRIKTECNKILNKPGNSMQKLAAYVVDQHGGGCVGSYDDLLYWYSQTALTTNIYRQWFYQTCSEFGFFQSGSSYYQPFGVNWFSSLSHSFCKDAFGPEFTQDRILQGIAETNRKYGALQPDVTNVISVHGTVDPWHAIGLLEDANPDAPAVVVFGTSHCADLSSISSSDSDEMRAAKQMAKDLIAQWIS